MDKTTGTEKVGGVFDFGPAPEADKDAAAVDAEAGTQETADTSNATQDTTQTTNDTTPDQPENQTVDGTEEKTDAAVVADKPFEVNGRTFASKDELATAYRNSSAEGIRLNKVVETKELQLQELNKKLLELEDKLGDAPFPGLLSTDKDQEAAQLEMLPQAKQMEYILNKKEWEKTQAATKQAREQQRTQMVEGEKRVKEAIKQSEQEMIEQPEKYPGYSKLKPTMDKIIELTPSIANRPETPYLSFWIAYGLNAFGKENAAASKTKDATAKATETAKSAHAQIGKSGTGKQATTTGEASSIVGAWRNRNGVGL